MANEDSEIPDLRDEERQNLDQVRSEVVPRYSWWYYLLLFMVLLFGLALGLWYWLSRTPFVEFPALRMLNSNRIRDVPYS